MRKEKDRKENSKENITWKKMKERIREREKNLSQKVGEI